MTQAIDEVTLARIDAALARIEAVVIAGPPGALAAAGDLAARHAALRDAVAGVIGRIDALIADPGEHGAAGTACLAAAAPPPAGPPA